MPKTSTTFPDLGNQFGKPDLERLGLFTEMPMLNGKRHEMTRSKNEGKNMLCEGRKTKNGTQHGYFDDTFRRIFSKECLKGSEHKKKPSNFKNVSERPFMPPGGSKCQSGSGGFYGTFGGKIDAFSNKRRPKPPHKAQLANCVTNPGKKGGAGYPNICLSPYLEHKPDRYGLKPKYKEYGKVLGRAMVNVHYPKPFFDPNPFKNPEKIKPGPTYVKPQMKSVKVIPPGRIIPTGPAKWQGGSHAGCFNKFPEYISDRRKPSNNIQLPTKIFYPPSMAMKTYYTTSVLNYNVDFRLNKKNYSNFSPVYVNRLLSDQVDNHKLLSM